LLDVRDNLELSSHHIKKINIEEAKDIEELKGHFKNISEGMKMTSHVMDNTLKRFQVVQFEPLGEKFDPNLHEAILTLSQSEHPNNHIGAVMQSGWKIGDRVLRAAKVAIVKK
jgi:molecular chaperone GrpE